MKIIERIKYFLIYLNYYFNYFFEENMIKKNIAGKHFISFKEAIYKGNLDIINNSIEKLNRLNKFF